MQREALKAISFVTKRIRLLGLPTGYGESLCYALPLLLPLLLDKLLCREDGTSIVIYISPQRRRAAANCFIYAHVSIHQLPFTRAYTGTRLVCMLRGCWGTVTAGYHPLFTRTCSQQSVFFRVHPLSSHGLILCTRLHRQFRTKAIDPNNK